MASKDFFLDAAEKIREDEEISYFLVAAHDEDTNSTFSWKIAPYQLEWFKAEIIAVLEEIEEKLKEK